MADEDQDESQKTEDPTQKRLDDAFKKGQVPNSRELTSFMMLLVFAITIGMLAPSIMKNMTAHMIKFIESPQDFMLDSASLILIAKQVLIYFIGAMSVPVLVIIISIIISSIMQHPLLFSLDAPAPKLERISIMKGFKRIFSMRNFVEFLKGVFKITVVGTISYLVIISHLKDLEGLGGMGTMAALLLLLKMALQLMIGICIFMAIVGAVDFIYQKFEYTKSLRMSKRDIKDEYKQTEGSPEVKAKLREIRQKRAGSRMMSKVPEADVVITNPTHYAVALKYEEKMTEAPVVVAKGQDLIALHIKELAKESKVPVVENPPLARALFATVELEQEIPIEHYNAVAEVIRYVYSLKKKRA